MLHRLYFPHPPLSTFVENIWYYEGYNPGHTREKILPDGAIELIIDLKETPQRIYDDEASLNFRPCKKAWISGERTKYIVIGVQGGSMIGVRFRPGGAHPFFRFPISELSDSVIELDLIWGRLIEDIRDQLLEVSTPEEKLQRFESLLLKQVLRPLEPNRLISFAVHQLQQSPQFIAIRDLANTIGITQKHLISQFERIVGLRPKVFARVCKFQNVLKLIEQANRIEWTRISYECGYYDQSHFIKEFQKFSGVNPSTYMTQRGEYLNFVPLPEPTSQRTAH